MERDRKAADCPRDAQERASLDEQQAWEPSADGTDSGTFKASSVPHLSLVPVLAAPSADGSNATEPSYFLNITKDADPSAVALARIFDEYAGGQDEAVAGEGRQATSADSLSGLPLKSGVGTVDGQEAQAAVEVARPLSPGSRAYQDFLAEMGYPDADAHRWIEDANAFRKFRTRNLSTSGSTVQAGSGQRVSPPVRGGSGDSESGSVKSNGTAPQIGDYDPVTRMFSDSPPPYEEGRF